MTFGVQTHACPGYHVIRWGPEDQNPTAWGTFRGRHMPADCNVLPQANMHSLQRGATRRRCGRLPNCFGRFLKLANACRYRPTFVRKDRWSWGVVLNSTQLSTQRASGKQVLDTSMSASM